MTTRIKSFSLKSESFSLKSQIQRQQFSLLMFGTMFLAIIVSFTFCSTVDGQQYNSSPVNPDYEMESDAPQLVDGVYEPLEESEKRDIRSRNKPARDKISKSEKAVDQILQGSGNLDSPVVNEFFNEYLFAKMTQSSEANISTLGEQRTAFFKDFLSKKTTGGKRAQFIGSVVIPSMQQIINNQALTRDEKKNYHPAVRMNAVYILANLDSQPSDRISKRNPIPSADALKVLMTTFEGADFPANIKVAAMSGIQRHVEIDSATGTMDPAIRTKVAAQANSILADKASGQDKWEAEINYWLKRRSIQTLGLLGNAESLDTALNVLKSDEASQWLRLDALQTIGSLNMENVAEEKMASTSLAIADFLAGQLGNEAAQIDKARKKLIDDNMLFQDLDLEKDGTDYESDTNKPDGGRGGMDGGMGGGLGGAPGFGGGGRGPARNAVKLPTVELPNYQINQSRRRIKAIAFTGSSVLTENKGLNSQADEKVAKFVGNVVAELNALIEKSNIGLVDANPRRSSREPERIEEEELAKGITKRLEEMCQATSDDLKKRVRAQTGEAEESPVAAPGAAADGNSDAPDFGK